ncbi:MAG: ketoacyl-ACP synthase III [Gemmataceae bacterium]|nr:ketoacyl-ACP synthase III [Gemmataceae bacterium]
MNHAAITGWGSYSPTRILSNHDLEELVDTSDAWIRTRTGIGERRVAAPDETTSSMGVIAARRALERAELLPREIDLVICASTTPDHLLPATACLIQQQLGCTQAGAFDLNAACSGFIYGLAVASQFIQGGAARRVLLVSSETLTRFVNWQDRSTCVLFGDGAGAVVLEATPHCEGVLSVALGSRGDIERMLVIEAGGSALPASADTVARKAHYMKMRGNEVFKMAVRNMAQTAKEALAKANLTLPELTAVIPHQANLRILTATQEALDLPAEKMFINVDRHGNTGAASIALAMGEFLDSRPVQVGDHFLLVAFGGGLTWGACVLRWADIAAIVRRRAQKLSA